VFVVVSSILSFVLKKLLKLFGARAFPGIGTLKNADFSEGMRSVQFSQSYSSNFCQQGVTA